MGLLDKLKSQFIPETFTLPYDVSGYPVVPPSPGFLGWRTKLYEFALSDRHNRDVVLETLFADCSSEIPCAEQVRFAEFGAKLLGNHAFLRADVTQTVLESYLERNGVWGEKCLDLGHLLAKRGKKEDAVVVYDAVAERSRNEKVVLPARLHAAILAYDAEKQDGGKILHQAIEDIIDYDPALTWRYDAQLLAESPAPTETAEVMFVNASALLNYFSQGENCMNTFRHGREWLKKAFESKAGLYQRAIPIARELIRRRYVDAAYLIYALIGEHLQQKALPREMEILLTEEANHLGNSVLPEIVAPFVRDGESALVDSLKGYRAKKNVKSCRDVFDFFEWNRRLWGNWGKYESVDPKDTNQVHMLYFLGTAYEQAGQFAEAQQFLKILHEGSPGHTSGKAALERVEKRLNEWMNEVSKVSKTI